MMLVCGIVPAFVLGVLTGGRPGNFATQQLRFEWVLLVLLVAVSFAPAIDIPFSESILVTVVWIIPVLACIVVASLNFRKPGLGLVVIGLLLNLIVVAANVGMPVLIANIGFIVETTSAADAIANSWLHIPTDPNTRMIVLADVVPAPGPTGFRSMLSIGDLLIMIGVGRFVFLGMHEPDTSNAEQAQSPDLDV
ncbi:MAG: hypothetical protein CVT60_07155 [Actinobacteria bacterium HGW-Actinobacteria-10]|jgi:hypothetical protein|nr:MAG: hypothetical protein CVT60_07155 [Actinobacteria bacterium HGW-Actinobacteria-10]